MLLIVIILRLSKNITNLGAAFIILLTIVLLVTGFILYQYFSINFIKSESEKILIEIIDYVKKEDAKILPSLDKAACIYNDNL